MSTRPKFYVTTPIYYVNDKPHIGHAYTSIAADALARFKRLDGYEVMFLTGTDEHGQKVQKSAAAAGVEPKAFTDKVSQNFRDLAAALNLSNTDFIRTTEPRHYTAVQALWTRLVEEGQIYPANYGGWYAVRDEAFYTETELQKVNGKMIAPSGAECEWVEEPSYFFKLSEWGDRLLEFYDQNPDFIAPRSRRNEVISFVKSGMIDLSVSRTAISWGIPVPGDDKHVMYVWLDALTNYLTATGYPDGNNGFWPADLHLVGKDILRFHAVYWPAFLMAAKLPLPKHVFAHGWWTNEGQKISKSVGNVIDPLALIETYGLDQMRYFLLREVPFGNDGDFSHDAMKRRINSELANDLGNLAQRSLSMIAKNCGGRLPVPGAFSEADRALLDQAAGVPGKIRPLMNEFMPHLALAEIWQVVADANRYFAAEEPWKKKDDVPRRDTILYVTAEVLRILAVVAQPFTPAAMAKLLDLLAVSPEARLLTDAEHVGGLTAGVELPSPGPIFPRYIDPEESAKKA